LTSAFFGFGQDLDQRRLVEVFQRRQDRQAADKLGNEAELQEILGLDQAEHVTGAAILGRSDDGAEAIEVFLPRFRDDLVQAGEGAAADEQDVGGVDLQEFLLRMLPAALPAARRRPCLP